MIAMRPYKGIPFIAKYDKQILDNVIIDFDIKICMYQTQ